MYLFCLIFFVYLFIYFFDFTIKFIRRLDSEPLMLKYQVSKEKRRTLGIEFIPPEVGLKEIVESLKEEFC